MTGERGSISQVAADLITAGAELNPAVQPDGATPLVVGIYYDCTWPALLEAGAACDVAYMGAEMRRRLTQVGCACDYLTGCVWLSLDVYHWLQLCRLA